MSGMMKYLKRVASRCNAGSGLRLGLLLTLVVSSGVKAAPSWDSTFAATGGVTGSGFQIVNAIAVMGTNVYVAGVFTSAGGVSASNIARWNGTSWSALGSGVNAAVNALAVIGNDLYVGGSFSTAGGVGVNNLAKWNLDANSWSDVGGGVGNGNNYPDGVRALAAQGNNLYVAGVFASAGGNAVKNIALWNGTSWSALSDGNGEGIEGDGVNPPEVDALAFVGSTLYAGGSFVKAGGNGASSIAQWDGSNWAAVGSGTASQVLALAALGTDLYAGGGFSSIGGVITSGIAKWDGANWSAVSGGANGQVFSLANVGGNLYVGGNFTTVGSFMAGSISASKIAEWDGTNWTALGSGADDSVGALGGDSSGLFVGGTFTHAGGNATTSIARWNPDSAAAGDFVYVTNIQSLTTKVVEKYSAAGKDFGTFANINIQYASESVNPLGIAFDSSGNLYVAFYSGNFIEKFSSSGADLGKFADTASPPTGLAFDGNGNLFAAEENLIEKFTPAGSASTFASSGSAVYQGLAFDQNGNLYATIFNQAAVEKFSSSGNDLGTFATTGLNFPYMLTFDKDGNLYVGNYGDGTIRRFSPTGADLGVFASVGVGTSLQGMAFGSSGELYVANSAFSRVEKFSATGVSLGSFASLPAPWFIAVKQGGGGGGATLPTITFAATGPSSSASNLTFTTTLDASAVSALGDSNLTVRVQSSITPNDEGSWTDLPDAQNGANGRMLKTATGNYSLVTHAYPDSPNGTVSFRAIAAKPNFTDSISNYQGPFTLHQAVVTIHAIASSKADSTGQTTFPGDDLTYQLIVQNSGSGAATHLRITMLVPEYTDNTPQHNIKQFAASTIKISKGGAYVAATPGNLDAKIVWNDAGGINGNTNAALCVTYTIHIPSDVMPSDPNTVSRISPVNVDSYSVSSPSPNNHPPTPADAITSNATTPVVRILSAVSITATASASQVAPGGTFNYTFTVSNDSGADATNAVIVVDIPQYTRLAGPPLLNGKAVKSAALIHLSSGTDQLVILPGKLGHAVGKNTAVITVPIQAQWVDPAANVIPNLSTVDYAAAFLTDATMKAFSNSFTNRTARAGAFFDLVAIPPTGAAAPLFLMPTIFSGCDNNFVHAIRNSALNIASSANDSGIVNVAFQGSADNQPILGVNKLISDDPDTPQADIEVGTDSNNQPIDLVPPGGRVPFFIQVYNDGKSAADDVFIEDKLPPGTTLDTSGKAVVQFVADAPVKDKYGNPTGKTTLTQSAVLTGNSKKLFWAVEGDGQTLHIGGLHVEPGDHVSLTYSVLVTPQAQGGPAIGAFLDIRGATVASESSPQQVFGHWYGIPVQVTKPSHLELVAWSFPSRPGVSTDPSGAIEDLYWIYLANPNANPNPDDFQITVPGDQRTYFAVVNTGGVTAKSATVEVPIPAGLFFVRPAFIGANGAIDPKPKGWVSFTNDPPRTVVFNLGDLGAGKGAEVMLETVVPATLETPTGSATPSITAEVLESSATTVSKSKAVVQGKPGSRILTLPTLTLDESYLVGQRLLSDAQHIAKLGVMMVAPQNVKPGDDFPVIITVMNHGDDDAGDATIHFTIPPGMKMKNLAFGFGDNVSPEHSNGSVTTSQGSPIHNPVDLLPGDWIEFTVASNNAPADQTGGSIGHYVLHPATAATATVTLTAIGGNNTFSTVSHDDNYVTSGPLYPGDSGPGKIHPPSLTVHIDAPSLGNALGGFGYYTWTSTVVGGADFVTLRTTPGLFQQPQTITVVPLGSPTPGVANSGQIVASGGGNLIGSDASGVVAQGGGNVVASGGGNLITLAGLSSFSVSNGADLFHNLASIVSHDGGTFIYDTGAGNLIGSDGAGVISNDGGSLIANVADLVKGGVAPVVSQGGGNVVSQGGGNVVSQGGGNLSILAGGGGGAGCIVVVGGGIIDLGGGNVVSQGGGNVVAQGGGNLVNMGGQSFAISLQNSAAVVSQGGGNVVSQGGGNVVAAGGGN